MDTKDEENDLQTIVHEVKIKFEPFVKKKEELRKECVLEMDRRDRSGRSTPMNPFAE